MNRLGTIALIAVIAVLAYTVAVKVWEWVT